MEMKLTINGREYPIHYKMLMAIAENLPSGENYASLAKSLVALDITSLTEEILNRVS